MADGKSRIANSISQIAKKQNADSGDDQVALSAICYLSSAIR